MMKINLPKCVALYRRKERAFMDYLLWDIITLIIFFALTSTAYSGDDPEPVEKTGEGDTEALKNEISDDIYDFLSEAETPEQIAMAFEKYPKLVTYRNEYGTRSLTTALFEQNVAMANALIDRGHPVNYADDKTHALHYAVRGALFDTRPHPDNGLTEADMSPRMLPLVKRMLDLGVSPYVLDEEGQMPIHRATGIFNSNPRNAYRWIRMCPDYYVELLDTLVKAMRKWAEEGRAPRGVTPKNFLEVRFPEVDATPLRLAAHAGSLPALRFLYKNGADAHNRSRRDKDPSLNYTKDPACIRFLVEEAGVDINATNIRGETSAYIATYGLHPAALKTLIELGARIDIKAKDGKSPLDVTEADMTMIYRFVKGEELKKKKEDYREVRRLLGLPAEKEFDDDNEDDDEK